MSKIAIVYWSGTGNTEAMAKAVEAGVKEKGGESILLKADEFNGSMVDKVDGVALGCSAMGAEVLEESEFQPMFDNCKPLLKGKKVALFGSYGWGDGEWMRNWEEDCNNQGINLVCQSVICNEIPDEDGIKACKALGAALIL